MVNVAIKMGNFGMRGNCDSLLCIFPHSFRFWQYSFMDPDKYIVVDQWSWLCLHTVGVFKHDVDHHALYIDNSIKYYSTLYQTEYVIIRVVFFCRGGRGKKQNLVLILAFYLGPISLLPRFQNNNGRIVSHKKN